jgi:hypothetical protein
VELAADKLTRLATRIVTGDPELLRRYDRERPQRGLDEDDAHTVKGISYYLDVYPEKFDWLNNTSDANFLSTLLTAIQLFAENGLRHEEHLFEPTQPSDPMVAAQADLPMTIYPAFFQWDWTDPLGPALAITHEYFHYLFVPGTRQKVFHGASSPHISGRESALRNAKALSGLVMWLAFGRAVEGT